MEPINRSHPIHIHAHQNPRKRTRIPTRTRTRKLGQTAGAGQYDDEIASCNDFCAFLLGDSRSLST